MERSDGYPGLIKHYGWSLDKEPKGMDPGLMYKAIAEKDVDLICGFATDGRIPAFDLVMLEDDKQFFPPYYAAPVVRADALGKYSELRGILEKLAVKIDDKTMAQLNYEVDEKGRQAAEVAREFLQKEGLIEAN
jgi:glycine betaine/choline ABC-type transport system substrate-binding protein